MREVTVTIRVPELDLRAHAQRLRRPPALVLWGGRPGVDMQAMSPEHLALVRRQQRLQKYQIIFNQEGMRGALLEFARVVGEIQAAQARGLIAAGRSLRKAGLIP